jgi:tellurite resistance protein
MNENSLTHHSALIHLMVLVSASDSEMTDTELEAIGRAVRQLPVFETFDEAMLPATAETCATLLAEDNGLDTVLALVADLLPAELADTAYALACQIAVIDRSLSPEELRVLELVRQTLHLDRLTAAGIERGVGALNKPWGA